MKRDTTLGFPKSISRYSLAGLPPLLEYARKTIRPKPTGFWANDVLALLCNYVTMYMYMYIYMYM